jgi:uncharacterized membrane protein YidH (DUF202 family)
MPEHGRILGRQFMATTSTVNVPSSIRVLAILVMAAGAIMMVAGVATWFTVQSQLSDERITVSDDAATSPVTPSTAR